MRVRAVRSPHDLAPAGTVTFVFTDIEDSTELLKRLGDGYPGVLSTHRRIIRGAFSKHDGIEIDTQGDAFFFAFPRARDAVAAAVEAQRAHAAADWAGGEAVRVRMGLHTGEPAIHEEGYVGLDVVRAARICTVGTEGRSSSPKRRAPCSAPEFRKGSRCSRSDSDTCGESTSPSVSSRSRSRSRALAEGRVQAPVRSAPCDGGPRRARSQHRTRFG